MVNDGLPRRPRGRGTPQLYSLRFLLPLLLLLVGGFDLLAHADDPSLAPPIIPPEGQPETPELKYQPGAQAVSDDVPSSSVKPLSTNHPQASVPENAPPSSAASPSPPPTVPKPRAPGMWDEPTPALRPPLRHYKVGLCISIPPRAVSMYTNGARQAAFFLHQLLAQEGRHQVYLINLDQGEAKNMSADWQLDGMRVVRLEEALDLKLDVVIEIGMQMRQDQVDDLKRSGAKVTAYRSGYNYIMNVEAILYNKSKTTMFETRHYDQVWTLPSFLNSEGWLGTIYESPVSAAPYLWSPRYFDYIVEALSSRHYYEPRANKTIAVFEPNLNVVKTSVLPMTAIELLYREAPDSFSKAYVTNSDHLAKKDAFKAFVQRSLSAYVAGKMFFESRYRFAWFLSSHTDVVLSHQWGCALNYLYIEALYAGYPLVHNSPYFQAKVCVWRHSPFNPDNVYEWEHLLDEVYERPWSSVERDRLASKPPAA
ncbi:uncharacterized protein MONBRDRAFT_37438 [Monosiga brevicollis MX1]|uniref:Protein xylosyltransferase n=1 Tax=Monosiga brevicollis TaxID=81824 RepID=A9V1R2_MONBE|nr:uncharacterized protein MONBRDRAFT_37438 [Monosiga brevicollis MX1]EDQ88490.1 predicted protein [Monosiga brevicollis MX1]|eukprot:XP_001746594.1 hypothetical protein [Monosiga brevicollis MX1]